MQRVATYFSKALSYQVIDKNFDGACKVLSKPFSTSEELLGKKLFFDLYPFLRMSYAITNQAITEIMQGLQGIHILDLSASHDATQWILLMQSLKERSSSTRPPYLKITCVNTKQEVLDQMRLHLIVEAEKLNLPLEFNAIVSTLENLDLEKLPIQKGEAIAISIVLQLHSLLATDDPVPMVNPSSSASMHQQQTFEEVLGKQKKFNASPDSALSPPFLSSSPKMECFLYGLWNLQPRAMVITEQESNVNGPTLTDRVDKALNFYASLFDCLESTFSNTLVERILLEKMLLGEQIRNVIACEGAQRKERHEKLKRWIPRLELAGFGRVPISLDGIFHASKQLQNYGHGYKIIRKNKCLLICWNDMPLFSVSAWRFQETFMLEYMK